MCLKKGTNKPPPQWLPLLGRQPQLPPHPQQLQEGRVATGGSLLAHPPREEKGQHESWRVRISALALPLQARLRQVLEASKGDRLPWRSPAPGTERSLGCFSMFTGPRTPRAGLLCALLWVPSTWLGPRPAFRSGGLGILIRGREGDCGNEMSVIGRNLSPASLEGWECPRGAHGTGIDGSPVGGLGWDWLRLGSGRGLGAASGLSEPRSSYWEEVGCSWW